MASTSVLDHDLRMDPVNGDFDRENQMLGIGLLGVSKLLRPGTLPS